ncbi:MAG: hypothetical protein ACKUBY_00255 [Candidatus Moraniibacteriota bacterium]|jgi:hypothetical protein
MSGRLSCNQESIFHRNSVHQSIVGSGIDKATPKDSLLHGAEVDVFIGGSIHQCIIESGIGGSRPFCARSVQSGIIRQQFTAETAKELRLKGSVPNMIRVW